MSRKRWVQVDGQLIEVGSDYEGEHRHHGRVHGDLHYDGMRATDGADISTRAKHRAYMKAKGLTTADDFTETWKRAAEERQRTMQGHDPSRRRDIDRALYQVQTGKRPER
jgi:hypothetical protein